MIGEDNVVNKHSITFHIESQQSGFNTQNKNLGYTINSTRFNVRAVSPSFSPASA
jgi:hypothetical protein